ncbi:hypothetical protein RND81_04G183100 [Saponaria officinalis]|uniref:Tetraspanin-6 n=1 Tax=Saponaria officinalis TaxID=3572 RepID=A0AAW1LKT4_SAPOF
MKRMSNTIIGFLNLFTLLVSLPIIGGGLIMAKNSTTCESFLQKPLTIIGFIILIVSIAGFLGACFNITWALWVYLVTMLILIVSLMIITLFGFVVTGQGGGAPVVGRVYKEYHIQDYSIWLRDRVKESENWRSISGCVFGSKTCHKVASWTPFDYMRNGLTPVQSGCCKPPTSCTYGPQGPIMMGQDPDCYKWNNDPNILCYNCDSCKAGVLETIRKDWHKLSILNVVILILLVALYSIGCCAFQNARRADTDYLYGLSGLGKVRPRWNFY